MILLLKHSANLECTQSVSRHCFPILITRHELATGLGTSITATKRTLPPKSHIFFSDAKETNSKGEMKERDDLERQEEASSFGSSCRAAQSLPKPRIRLPRARIQKVRMFLNEPGRGEQY